MAGDVVDSRKPSCVKETAARKWMYIEDVEDERLVLLLLVHMYI